MFPIKLSAHRPIVLQIWHNFYFYKIRKIEKKPDLVCPNFLLWMPRNWHLENENYPLKLPPFTLHFPCFPHFVAHFWNFLLTLVQFSSLKSRKWILCFSIFAFASWFWNAIQFLSLLLNRKAIELVFDLQMRISLWWELITSSI